MFSEHIKSVPPNSTCQPSNFYARGIAFSIGMLCLLLLTMPLRLYYEREINQAWLPVLMGWVTLNAYFTPICIHRDSSQGFWLQLNLQVTLLSSCQYRHQLNCLGWNRQAHEIYKHGHSWGQFLMLC